MLNPKSLISNFGLNARILPLKQQGKNENIAKGK